jgi:short-subunit dehydrogenase
MNHWDNKVVWITGASTGIGRALAHAFGERNARCILSSRTEKNLNETAELLGGDRDSVRVLPLDITETGSLAVKEEEARSYFGRIDLLVNNAGISHRSLLEETDLPVIEKLLYANLMGHIVLTRCVLPGMIRRESGCIVGVSSLVGLIGSPYRTIYSAAKHGLHGFYDSLRAEVMKHGIQVTLAVPGFIRTEISKHAVTGNGSFYGVMDKNQETGISPEACAEQIVRGIEKKKLAVYTGFNRRARLAVFLQARFPGVLARILTRADVT